MIATQSLTSTQPPRALIAKRYLPAALWLFYILSCFQLYQSLFSGFFFIPFPGRWDRGWGMDRELGKWEGITISLPPLLTSPTWASGREVWNAAPLSGRDSIYPALIPWCAVLCQICIKTETLNTWHTKSSEQLWNTEAVLRATWLLIQGDTTNSSFVVVCWWWHTVSAS